MNLPYSVRLLCLSLASFFLVNLAAGLLVSTLTKAAERFAWRMRVGDGARLLFALRLAPVTLGLCTVCCLCVPSYLWMEPEAIDEPVGWLCLLVAVLAVLAWLLSAIRAGGAVMRSRRYVREFPACERELCGAGDWCPGHVIEDRERLFMMSGIMRHRLLVSEYALDAFPAEELVSCFRHEQAHGDSHDNLKRLLMLLAPDILPFVRTMQPLERAWAALAEWAADDRASAGDPRRSVSLASALVRAARIVASPAPPPDLLTALLADGQDLSTRVDRLLRNSAPEAPRKPAAWVAGVLVITSFALLALLRPATLAFAHAMLERLVR